jgi:type 1 glutamine amidotransferase
MRLITLALVVACATAASPAQEPRVLFFTMTAGGYVHDVVKRPAPAQLAIAEKALIAAVKGRFSIDATQDPAELTREKLSAYRAVIFYTAGEPPIDRAALLDYIRNGGGFVGVHSGTATYKSHADYVEMIGGVFESHPWNDKVRIKVEDREHPSTRHLGESFEIADEIYQFSQWERKNVRVLFSLDVASVDLGAKGVKRQDKDFALAWTRDYGRGRVFYTALGHREEVWKDARFLKHLVAGIGWAAGLPDHHVDPPKLPVDAEGFEVLFDGKSAEGWRHAGIGGFKVEDGYARPYGGMGLWYYERKRYRNFILKLEFRQKSQNSNSGVYIRFPRVEGDPWVPVNEGYEIQIAGNRASKGSTGSVYSFQAAESVPLKPAGEWNEYEITNEGQTIKVRLNGELINTYKGDRGLTGGMIGVQNHDNDSSGRDVVDYRNIRVKPLPDAK